MKKKSRDEEGLITPETPVARQGIEWMHRMDGATISIEIEL